MGGNTGGGLFDIRSSGPSYNKCAWCSKMFSSGGVRGINGNAFCSQACAAAMRNHLEGGGGGGSSKAADAAAKAAADAVKAQAAAAQNAARQAELQRIEAKELAEKAEFRQWYKDEYGKNLKPSDVW